MRTEYAATLRLAGPLVLTNLLQMAVYAVDVVFVARLGAFPLAVSSLALALFGVIMWSTSSFVAAVSPLIAAERGRKRHAVREVRRTVRMGLWLAVALGVLCMGISQLAEPLMLLTGQSPQLASAAGDFLGVLQWAVIPTLLATVLRSACAALDRPGYATAVTVLALIVNSLGNWLLVFGNAGFPAWGLYGSAVSSVMTGCAMVLGYVVLVSVDRRLRRYAFLGRWWCAEWSRLRELVRIGLPIALTVLAEGGLFSSAAFLMGRLGEAELAGHTLALQIAALAFQVPFGVAQAATIRVGLAYGAGDRAGIARAGRAALVVGVGFMLVTATLMLVFPHVLLSAYVDVGAVANAAMVGFAVQYLMLGAAFQLFDGAQAVGAGLLRGLQDTRVPMWMALAGYWLPGFGTAVALGLYTPLRGQGVWIGLAVGLVVVSVLLLARWHRREQQGLTQWRDASPVLHP